MACAWSAQTASAGVLAADACADTVRPRRYPAGVPVPDSLASGLFGYSWVPARWTAPDGRPRSGNIPVQVGMADGRTVPIWVDAVGRPTDAPLTDRAVQARAATAAAVATVALLIVLSVLAWAGRKLLDRRRLTDWELAWAVVGPQWTKRFRSRG